MKQDELRETIKSKGYNFFDNSVNLIGERTSDNFTNKFTDYLHVAYHDYKCNQKQVVTIPQTTVAGTLGNGGALNPITTGGINVATGQQEVVKGVAILKEGQYSKTYQFIDSYVGWLYYPYFYQAAPVDVYRDGVINYTIDRDSPIHRGLFGINLHRMSNNGVVSQYLNFENVTQSQGCQGAIEPEFKKILPIIREDVKKFGNLFTYTLIQSKDIKE